MSEPQVSQFAEVYRSVCSIPSPISARYLPSKKNHFMIESLWGHQDVVKMANTTFTRSYFGFVDDLMKTEISSSIIHDNSAVTLVAYSKSGNLVAILIEQKNSSLHQIIEIWDKNHKIKSFDVLEMKLHGKIYDDGFLSTFVWNESEDTLMYVAEKYVSNSASYFKQCAEGKIADSEASSVTKGEEYVYRGNWGEAYTDRSHSVLCTLAFESGKITVLPIFQNENESISLCQPVWCHQSNRMIFVGYFESPYRLGLKFCMNRLSRIFLYSFDGSVVDVISGVSHVNARSPRLSFDDKTLVWIQNRRNGPHNTCCQLMKHTADGGIKVLVDVVNHSLDATFPGIYTDSLPERCFSSNGRYVFFSSVWRSRKVILTVDLETNAVQRVPVDASISSCTVLDVYDDMVVASASAPNVEPFLIAGKLCFDNDFVTVFWTNLDKASPRIISDMEWSENVLEPTTKNNKFPNLDFESILLTPKNGKAQHPLILVPHGGPHSVFTASFNIYHVAFVKLGYAVCLVNYRGSIGFGQDSICSLLGNIGTQDVQDVHHALRHCRQDERFATSDVFLFGGSHGGFLSAHLSAKYPEEFAACVCRNPVIDIACMSEGTDIPDWPMVECGLVETFRYSLPDQNALCEMWDRSPIKVANMVTVPTLVIVGKQDRRVPSSQGIKYYHVLQKNGVPTRMYCYDDNHCLASCAAQSDGFMQTMLWIHKYRTST